MEGVNKNVEHYKSFPEAHIGLWGPEVREKAPEKLDEAILGRIRHISGRMEQYLPPYENLYNVDQKLINNLNNSFNELASIYLDLSKEGYGGYLKPLKDDGHYSYERIKAFDEKLEDIHALILDSEKPFFDEKREKILIDIDSSDKQDDKATREYKFLSEEDKKDLHEKGLSMLKESLSEIKDLISILNSRSEII